MEELATERIQSAKKKNASLNRAVEGLIILQVPFLIPLSGEFQARQEVCSCNVDKY